MRSSPVSRWNARIFILLVAVLAVSGLAQMPIFKRYYVADLPGLAWLADYWFTHAMHYVAAALLLAFLGWIWVRWLGRWRPSMRLTATAWVRLPLVLLIVGTGVMRMIKNQPGMSFSPGLTMVVDWAHLGFVLLLGLTALGAVVTGHSAYLVRRRTGGPGATDEERT